MGLIDTPFILSGEVIKSLLFYALRFLLMSKLYQDQTDDDSLRDDNSILVGDERRRDSMTKLTIVGFDFEDDSESTLSDM